MCRIPLNRDIVGKFLGLYDEVKGRAVRVKKKSKELLKKLSLPFIFK